MKTMISSRITLSLLLVGTCSLISLGVTPTGDISVAGASTAVTVGAQDTTVPYDSDDYQDAGSTNGDEQSSRITSKSKTVGDVTATGDAYGVVGTKTSDRMAVRVDANSEIEDDAYNGNGYCGCWADASARWTATTPVTTPRVMVSLTCTGVGGDNPIVTSKTFAHLGGIYVTTEFDDEGDSWVVTIDAVTVEEDFNGSGTVLYSIPSISNGDLITCNSSLTSELQSGLSYHRDTATKLVTRIVIVD